MSSQFCSNDLAASAANSAAYVSIGKFVAAFAAPLYQGQLGEHGNQGRDWPEALDHALRLSMTSFLTGHKGKVQ
jgi:hypothetical protein